jgi:hypothetical protein
MARSFGSGCLYFDREQGTTSGRSEEDRRSTGDRRADHNLHDRALLALDSVEGEMKSKRNKLPAPSTEHSATPWKAR